MKSRKSHKKKILQEFKKKKKDNSRGLENVKKTFLVELGLAIKYLVQKKLEIWCLWSMLATAVSESPRGQEGAF